MTHFPINGLLPDAFSGLRDVIDNNVTEYDELGFQFCVMRHGEPLIDICAGYTDRKTDTTVTPETLFAVFSSGKAIAALVIAHLAENDRLGYEQLVASIWPGFTGDGKDTLTVAQVMSHQAGLCGITNPDWTPQDWFDWDKTITQLESQVPIFEPGTGSGYHPVTFGFLAGEIAQQSDKRHRSLGEILRTDICEPAQADVWIGLPEREHHRCAQMQKPKALADMGEINEATRVAFMKPWSSPGGRGITAWREAELAGSNCHATARGLATLMQAGVDGRIANMPFLSEDMLPQFSAVRSSGRDRVLPFDIDFAAGVMRNTNGFYGPNPETLGHSGWGGSCVFADPISGLHGAYAMNRQRATLLGDARPVDLIRSVFAQL